MTSDAEACPEIDITASHAARVWNYWLGGKDHYAVDRELGDQILAVLPQMSEWARACRAFLARAVHFLAKEAGVRQFLDIGAGLPAAENTHEIAQRVAPEARVVYVDNDPLVLSHARALLAGSPDGVTDHIDGDLRAPDAILRGAARSLDLSRPVGLTLMGVMEFVTDDAEAYAIADRLLDALSPGSYLALYGATNTIDSEVAERTMALWNAGGTAPGVLRSREGIARFFSALKLVEPGVVSIPRWRPDDRQPGTSEPPEPPEIDVFGGVALKP